MDIFLLIAGPLIVWSIASYALLARDNDRVLSAWDHLDAHLRRRYELTTELIGIISLHAHHEQAALRTILSEDQTLADSIDVHQRGKFEAKVSSQVERLLAIVDAYPDLKSTKRFLALQRQLSQAENQLRLARDRYNESVRNLNKRVEKFPDRLIVQLRNCTQHVYFQVNTLALKPRSEPHRGGLQNSHC